MDRRYDVVSKGTDDHLFLVSFIEAGLTGKADVDAVGRRQYHGEQECGAERSAVAVLSPRESAWHTGGDDTWLDETACRELAGWMCDVIDGRGDAAVIDAVKAKVLETCAKHPVYA